MAISPADARRLDQLKLRWRDIRMEKLRRQMDNSAYDYAMSCANLYTELYGENLAVVNASYVDGNCTGFSMRLRSNSFVSQDRLIDFQTGFANHLNKTMDFKLITNNEFEMFVMED